MLILEPDVSFWQGDIDFGVMVTKTKHIIFKSSQRNYADPKFQRNRSEAIRVGLPWSIYHFYDGRSSPRVQAETIANILDSYPMPIEIWVDWERSYMGAYEGIINVVACMGLVESMTGIKTGMYTGYWWFRENSNAVAHANQYKFLGQRKLWEAWYTYNHQPSPNPDNILVPKPWTKMDIHQYGTPAIGYSMGVQSREIDMNQRFTPLPNTPSPQQKVIRANFGNTIIEYKEK
jgi:GH25 family lysozyme M1 (1,4-beta-N-acetylmuramidase)